MFKKFSALLTALMLTVALQARAEVIKIGVIAPMSGPFSLVGQSWDAGLKAFLKMHGNKVGDSTVEVIYRDLPDVNPAQAKALAQELIIKEKVQYLGGLYFTPDALAVGALVQEAKVPTVIFNAATSAIIDKSQYLLRTSYTTAQVSVPVAKYALEKHVKTAVTMVTDYGPGVDSENAFVNVFTAGGGKVLEKIRTPLKTTDYGPFMQKAKALKPDAVFFFAPGGPPTFALVKAYSQSGMKEAGIRYLGTGETNEHDLPTLGPGAMGFETGMYYSPQHKSALNEQFVKAVKEVAPDVIPSITTVAPYDAMQVIYHMIEATQGRRDPDKALAAARGYAWESPRGPVRIDAKTRDLIQNIYIRAVDKDAQGNYYNREFKTYEMQPDYGRTLESVAK